MTITPTDFNAGFTSGLTLQIDGKNVTLTGAELRSFSNGAHTPTLGVTKYQIAAAIHTQTNGVLSGSDKAATFGINCVLRVLKWLYCCTIVGAFHVWAKGYSSDEHYAERVAAAVKRFRVANGGGSPVPERTAAASVTALAPANSSGSGSPDSSAEASGSNRNSPTPLVEVSGQAPDGLTIGSLTQSQSAQDYAEAFRDPTAVLARYEDAACATAAAAAATSGVPSSTSGTASLSTPLLLERTVDSTTERNVEDDRAQQAVITQQQEAAARDRLGSASRRRNRPSAPGANRVSPTPQAAPAAPDVLATRHAPAAPNVMAFIGGGAAAASTPSVAPQPHRADEPRTVWSKEYGKWMIRSELNALNNRIDLAIGNGDSDQG